MREATICFFQKSNNREIAVAIWILIGLAWSLSHSKIRKSFFQLIKALFAWKLTISYIAMLLYIALLIVIPLKLIGIWDMAHLQLTFLWVVCVAFVMLCQFSKANDKSFFKDVIKTNLKILIILEFIVNLYVFSFLIELLLAPILVILGILLAVSEDDEKYAPVRRLLNGILSLIVLSMITFAIYMMIDDIDDFATIETFASFYLPILFTTMFLPFVYLIALFASYESLFVHLYFLIEDPTILKYTKMKTLLTFRLNLWALNKWSQHIILSYRFKNKNEVDHAVANFINKKREH